MMRCPVPTRRSSRSRGRSGGPRRWPGRLLPVREHRGELVELAVVLDADRLRRERQALVAPSRVKVSTGSRSRLGLKPKVHLSSAVPALPSHLDHGHVTRGVGRPARAQGDRHAVAADQEAAYGVLHVRGCAGLPVLPPAAPTSLDEVADDRADHLGEPRGPSRSQRRIEQVPAEVDQRSPAGLVLPGEPAGPGTPLARTQPRSTCRIAPRSAATGAAPHVPAVPGGAAGEQHPAAAFSPPRACSASAPVRHTGFSRKTAIPLASSAPATVQGWLGTATTARSTSVRSSRRAG